MSLIRPIFDIAEKVVQFSPLPKWIKWIVCGVGFIVGLYPYLRWLESMIEISNSIMLGCTLAVLVGAVAGPLLLLRKGKNAGNGIDKVDFLDALLGMAGGAFAGYMMLNLYGGAWVGALGDMSYLAISGLSAIIGGIFVTLICLSFSGVGWGLGIFDIDKDGDVDLDDLRALSSKISALIQKKEQQ